MALNGRMGHILGENEELEAAVEYNKYYTIKKRNPDYNATATNMDKFPTTCTDEVYDDCIYTMLDKEFKELGCSVPWILNNDNICTDNQSVIQKAFDIHWYYN